MGSRSVHGSWVIASCSSMAAAAAADGRSKTENVASPSPRVLISRPAARCHDLFDELVVSRERHRHGVGIGLPGCGRPLDVGEEEGDCARYGRDMLCHRHIQRSILGDDGGLEPPKVRPRIDPQLVGQQRPCPLISAKGLALPACAVEGEHQLAPSPLAKWCVGDGGFEFADDLRGTARREQRIRSVFHQCGVSLDPARLLRRALVGRRAVRGSRARGSAPLRSGPPPGLCRRRRRRRGPAVRPPCNATRPPPPRPGSSPRPRSTRSRRRARDAARRCGSAGPYRPCAADHRPRAVSTRASADTTDPLCSPSIVRMARGLAPGIVTGAPSCRTWRGPKTPSSTDGSVVT